jgi:hypothetical protein
MVLGMQFIYFLSILNLFSELIKPSYHPGIVATAKKKIDKML